MKIKKLFKLASITALLLGSAWPAASYAADETLPPLPGAEYERGASKSGKLKRRDYTYVEVGDIVEGSPQWVFKQFLRESQKMDFVELAKYQGPAGVRRAQKTPPAAMAQLTDVKMDGKVRIGDSKMEADRCYFYMGFEFTDGLGSWDMAYRYFLKRDGKWIMVSSGEWQRGEFEP